MTSPWKPPPRLPVWFDVAQTPPPHRITVRPSMTPLRLAVSMVRSGGWVALVGCLLFTGFSVVTALVPLAIGAAIDQGIGPVAEGAAARDALGGFVGWLAVIAGLYVLIDLTYRFGGRMGWYCVQRAQYELSARVVERILDVRGTAGAPPMPGRLLSVATSDCARTCSALYFAIYPLGHVVAIAVAAVSLWLIHPVLGIVVVGGAPVLLAAMALVARPLRVRARREQETVADASGVAADLTSGYRVIAGLHAHDAAATHYRAVSRTALRSALSANTAEGALIGINAALTALFAGIVTVTAAGLALDGSISVGGLIAAAAMAQVILGPLRELIETAATLGAQVLASAGRVLDLLRAAPHPAALGAAPIGTPAEIRIDSPRLSEPLRLRRGELVALDLAAVDAESLLGALTLTASTTDWSVSLDGRTLTEHDPGQVRRTVLVAPHHADLLEPTVLDNVARGASADVAPSAALLAARCESLEHELPLGFDTPLGDGGRTLSGGQRQRVALARALARDTAVLVLHEPTNAVDVATEHDLSRRVRDFRRERATLVLTSSPAFHAAADRSVVADSAGAR